MELLIAVLVVAFASMIVAAMFSTAFSANIEAQKSDKTYYDALSEMETMTRKDGDENSGNNFGIKVNITDNDNGSVEVDATKYGNGTYSSYRFKEDS